MANTTEDAPRVLNPADLVIEANVREDTKITKEFLASIKQHGVTVPVLVERLDDSWKVIDGQRRVLAAVQLELPEIPVHVIDNSNDAGRLIAQLVVNDQRESLSEADHTKTYKQLALIGITADQIARKTNTPRKRVETALAVANSQIASEVLATGNVTLDQAAVILEFEDLPEHVEHLTNVALVQPAQFDHAVSSARAQRVRADERAALVNELTQAGYEISDEFEPYQGPNGTVARIDYLYADEARSKRLAKDPAERIAFREGLKAVVYERYNYAVRRDEWLVAFFIDGWKDQGLFVSTAHEKSASTGGGLTDEQKAERKLTRDNNKLWGPATTVRLTFVKDLLQQKEPPAGWELFVADFVANTAVSNERSFAATLLGVGQKSHYDLRKWLSENPTKAIAFLIAMGIAAVENSWEFGKSGWRSDKAPAYLVQLSKWGYTLSELEETVAKKAASK